jgi:hypothetical protein
MCIYCTTNNYRKIYEHHHGPIPKDEQGRSYDIHHIDGNHYNNDPSNLKAVSLLEHLEIHEQQGDYWASMLIARRINRVSYYDHSELARKNALKRIEQGTHNFQKLSKDERRQQQLDKINAGTHQFCGERNPVYKQLEDGTHPFIGGEVQRKLAARLIAEGKHNLQGGHIQRKRVAEGTHNFLGPEHNRRRVERGEHNFLGGELQSQVQQRRLKDGTHNLVGPDSPSQQVYTCPHCNKTGKGGGMLRYHFDKCKQRKL